MQYTRFDLFKMLVEQEVEHHNKEVHFGIKYQVIMEVGDNSITIYEKDGTTAHCLDQFIKMADACRFHYYFMVFQRKDGGSIPALHIF